MSNELRRILPKATWTAAGIGINQARVMEWVLARGGDGVRTGLEDNIRISKDRLAASNAELVIFAAAALARHGRRPATADEARKMLAYNQAKLTFPDRPLGAFVPRTLLKGHKTLKDRRRPRRRGTIFSLSSDSILITACSVTPAFAASVS